MKYLATIAFLLAFITVDAQSFTARVNRTEVKVGENFKLEFELQGDGSRFTPPPLEDFMLLSGPNKSSNMQWVNGNFSSSVSYSFILRPTREGEFIIGPATVEMDGELVETESIRMTVVSRSQAHSTPHQQTQKKQQGKNNDVPTDVSTNIFMRLVVDKKDVFVGEQLLATYKLYLSVNVMDYEFNNLVFNGFYAEDLKVGGQNSVTTEVINGRQFQVHTLKQTLLTPQKSGELELPALESTMLIRVQEKRRSRSLFDQVFGNYKNAQIELASNPETIHVKPLPLQDQPIDFTGAVGSFEVDANVDRSEVNSNEAINLTFTVKGKGNLELISTPNIEFPSDFETYDPKVKSNITPSASGSRGSKIYEYVVIPRYEGSYDIEPIGFTYFNPKSQQYERATTSRIPLSIRGTQSEEGGVTYVAPKKEDVQIIGKDIRYIATDQPNLRRQEDRFFGSTIFYILGTLPFAGMGAAVFLMSFIRAQRGDVAMLRRRKAGGIAKKHLAKARKLRGSDSEAFYEAISLALFGYLSDKLSIQQSNLSRETIEEELEGRGISPTLQSDLKKALDECEMIRFAPGVVRGQDEMLTASESIIESLEDEL